MSPAVARFKSCRWRRPPEDGAGVLRPPRRAADRRHHRLRSRSLVPRLPRSTSCAARRRSATRTTTGTRGAESSASRRENHRPETRRGSCPGPPVRPLVSSRRTRQSAIACALMSVTSLFQTKPRFRTAVDLVEVDAVVVDEQGQVVPNVPGRFRGARGRPSRSSVRTKRRSVYVGARYRPHSNRSEPRSASSGRTYSPRWFDALRAAVRANVSVYIVDPFGLTGGRYDGARSFGDETGGGETIGRTRSAPAASR